jgi:hypothetical protein
MPAKKYVVKLDPSEREQLLEMTRKGTVGARKMKRAQILLKADEGWKDEAIIEALNTSRSGAADQVGWEGGSAPCRTGMQ